MKDEPLVLCLTNTVAANFTANCLLSVRATPAMMEEPEEAAELAAASDALLINLGTVTHRQAEAMRAAIRAARAHGVPWVLDPVASHVLAFRRALALEFAAEQPTLVRGNAAEIAFLRSAVPALACPILATGETDVLYDNGIEVERIPGGTPLLQQVTATGCAQGALAAALLGRGESPLAAAKSVSRLMKRAGERAASVSSRPGSFQIALLDALSELSHD